MSEGPSIAVLVVHEVEDFDAWKPAFDEHRTVRVEHSVMAHHINRGIDNPNLLAVYLAATEDDKLKALFDDPELGEAMKNAGVKGPPVVRFMKPVLNETITDRPLVAAIISHKVEDFDKWRAAYDAHDDKRRSAGIVGHAVSTAYEDPNDVIAYLQAETVDEIKSFMGSEELKNAMTEAGVVGPPEVTYWNSAEWSMY